MSLSFPLFLIYETCLATSKELTDCILSSHLILRLKFNFPFSGSEWGRGGEGALKHPKTQGDLLSVGVTQRTCQLMMPSVSRAQEGEASLTDGGGFAD